MTVPSLVNISSGLKSQVHAVIAKEGVLRARTDMFGLGGQAQLDAMQVGDAYRIRIDSLRDLIDAVDGEFEALEAVIYDVLKDHRGYRAIQVIDGVGRTFAAIFEPRSATLRGSRAPSNCARGPG